MDVDPALILEALGSAGRFADPSAPLQARVMAAGGALPLPPGQIASVLFCLTFDPDEDVADKASDSLDALPEAVLRVAMDTAVPAGLLARWAERFGDNPDRLERIALNPATADETMCLVAMLPHGRVIDIVSRNQIRLLRSPDLVEALSENPAASQGTIDRVLEFLGIEADAEEAGEAEGVPEAPEPLAGTEAAGAETFDPDDPKGLPEDLVVETDEIEEDEEKLLSLYEQVQKMNVMEKVKLARFGNGEARALLVRDRNKIVALAAIRSPKLKESEVVSFAKSRNLSDEVLRVISNAREWTKSYQIKLALVMNPRTPLSSAIKFLNYLSDRDLKGLMRSRDVPGQISTHARRILGRKGKV